jgi:hypothetical protein
VPRHYGLTGKPDAWGRKGVIWGYPAISLIMFTLVWGVFLHERSKPGSTLGPHDTELMALMSGYVSLIMLIITIRTFAVAEERAEGLGWWLAPALAAGIVIMVARYT